MAETTMFPIMESSPQMKGEAKRERHKPCDEDMPFDALNVGESFRVPIEISESTLRVRVSRENANGWKRYSVINWGNCYEVGCVAVNAHGAPPKRNKRVGKPVSRETYHHVPPKDQA